MDEATAASPTPEAALAEAGLIGCAAAWGATFFLIKGALADAGAEAIVVWRFLIAAAAAAPLALRRPAAARPGRPHAAPALVLALWLGALYISQTAGLRYTTASNSGFITGLFVVFVPAFLWLAAGRRPGPWDCAATGLATLGLWLLTGGLGSVNRGDAMTLISAAAYAGHLLATDRYVRAGADPLLLAFHQFWMTGLLAAGWALAFGSSLAVASAQAWSVIVFLALVPSLAAFLVQMRAQRVTAPVRVSLIFSTEPVFAAAFSWTLGGEPFTAAGSAGGALIVAAMLLARTPEAA